MASNQPTVDWSSKTMYGTSGNNGGDGGGSMGSYYGQNTRAISMDEYYRLRPFFSPNTEFIQDPRSLTIMVRDESYQLARIKEENQRNLLLSSQYNIANANYSSASPPSAATLNNLIDTSKKLNKALDAKMDKTITHEANIKKLMKHRKLSSEDFKTKKL